MLDFNQSKERGTLQAEQEKLKQELAFAQCGDKPWDWRLWETGPGSINHCEDHGEFEQHILIVKNFRSEEALYHRSRCPDCIQGELANVEAKLHSLTVDHLVRNAGIARRFESCEFENYQPVNPAAEKNLNACRRYAATWNDRLKAGTGLVMCGSCGTGKNHLAVSMAKQIIRGHLANVEITDVMRITRAVKSTWRNNSDRTEESVLEHYASLDLLIIDEVGVQFGSPAEMAILQEVINARYESILPTILISNLTFEQLQENISERIVDRVTDGGRSRLAFNWESYRSRPAGEAV